MAPGRRSRIERHRLALLAALRQGRRGAFFEIGPGHGTLGELAVAGGWHYTAIEASPLLMEVLRKKGLKVIEPGRRRCRWRMHPPTSSTPIKCSSTCAASTMRGSSRRRRCDR